MFPESAHRLVNVEAIGMLKPQEIFEEGLKKFMSKAGDIKVGLQEALVDKAAEGNL